MTPYRLKLVAFHVLGTLIHVTRYMYIPKRDDKHLRPFNMSSSPGGERLTISTDIPSIVSSRFFSSLYLTFRSPENRTSRGTMWKENYNFLLVHLGYTLHKPESFSPATSKKHAVAKWQTTCAHTINRIANSKVTTFSF